MRSSSKVILAVAVVVLVGFALFWFVPSRTVAPAGQTEAAREADGNPALPVSQPPPPSPPAMEGTAAPKPPSPSPTPTTPPAHPSTDSGSPPPATTTVITITYDGSAFTPANITVKKGTTVVFKNESTDTFWPAANPHPTHTGYPEKGGCISSAFDACKAIAPGAAYSFTFTIAGSWKYHDHFNPIAQGVVVVQ